MATTDAALQKKQSLVEDLRQKVADVNAERQQKELDLSNDVQAAAPRLGQASGLALGAARG